ncbi:MAG: hypothetical protein WC662_04415 [Candidatus Paceibacterota bacterium]|jgi:nicotinamidase-related amidase
MKQFKKDDAIMLLMDHQVGTLNFCANRPHEMIVSRTRALARLAKALSIPVVLTSSQEDLAQGLIIPDLQDLLPEEYATVSNVQVSPMPGMTRNTKLRY